MLLLEILERDLPVFPSVVLQLLERLQDPNVAISSIDLLICQDPALAERVLRLANSPVYCARTKSQTIRHAIVRIGLSQVRNLVILAAAGEVFDENDPKIRALWDHSVASGLAASIIAEEYCKDRREEAFLAGIFHDVGKMAICANLPREYERVVDEIEQSGRRSFAVEAQEFRHFTHMSIGGLVLRKWGLGETLVETARFHHEVERNASMAERSSPLVCIASLASVMANNLEIGMPVCSWDEVPRLACARPFDVTLAHIDKFAMKINETFESQRAALRG